MQGDEDPNVVSSSKVPSVETNPHLKWKRDLCDDSIDSPPAKQTPMIISVSFSGFPSSYSSSTLMQGDEDPNVVSSLKAPSVETNSHLKQKRDFRDDPTDSPPAR